MTHFQGYTNFKTQAAHDTTNAVDRQGNTRPFVAFIPDTNGTAVVVNPDSTPTTNAIPVLAGHIYPFSGVRIKATGTDSTNYTAIFNERL